MKEFVYGLNELLVDTFKEVLKYEEEQLRRAKKINLTINETHMIEAIGSSMRERDCGITISELSEKLDITCPSVTVGVSKLEKKGYVERVKDQSDGRVVKVVLTKQGKKIDAVHKFFHEQLFKQISKDLNEEERRVLLVGINKIREYFKKSNKSQ